VGFPYSVTVAFIWRYGRILFLPYGLKCTGMKITIIGTQRAVYLSPCWYIYGYERHPKRGPILEMERLK
jgi:hypothetical protein